MAVVHAKDNRMEGCPWVALSPLSPSAQCHRRAWHSSSGLVFHVLYFDSNAISLYGMFDTTRNILLPKMKES